MGENLAWRKNLEALREDWEAAELSDLDFFVGVIDGSTPATAAEALVVIGERAASKFDLWFTMRFGDQIPERKLYFNFSTAKTQVGLDSQHRLREAFHRAVLNRREPL